MSTKPGYDSRNETNKTASAPDTRQLAAELGVDAKLLLQFTDYHPNPTAPIVLGWATQNGDLSAPPAVLRDDVEAWVEARRDTDVLDDGGRR
ncbi:MAG: hypothetical protein ACOCZD_00095 [Haloferacaceae archaeon]